MFNFVLGPGPEVGDELAVNPGTHAVAFTGSTETGMIVSRQAAGKVQLLEMGGNGPFVVLDDADLDAAADAAQVGCFLGAGQSCSAAERLLVHEAVREEFVARLAAQVERDVSLGDPLADTTTLGPLNNELTAAKMETHVADALERGAVVVAGGARSDGFPPLLARDDPGSRPAGLDRGDTGDVRADRADRVDRVDRGDRADELPGVRADGRDLHARRGSRPALRRLGSHGAGEHQRDDQLLGGPPAVGRPRSLGERHRPRRRPLSDETLTELQTVLIRSEPA